MIEWARDHLFGQWGPAIADLYGAHALPVNLVVVAYGVALVILHRRLRPYRAEAVRQVQHALRGRPAPVDRAARERIGDRVDWDAVAAIRPDALVVGRWHLWPRRASADTLRRMMPLDELCRDAADTPSAVGAGGARTR